MSNHGTYIETCAQNDPIVQIVVLIKGTHVYKHAGFSWEATYNNQVVSSYVEHWGNSGIQFVDFVAYSPDDEVQQGGRLSVVFKIGKKKVAASYINLSVPASG